MATKTNLERLSELSPYRIASVIVNLSTDMCLYCPREREHRCNNDCAAGLKEWLKNPFIPKSNVWKVKKTK